MYQFYKNSKQKKIYQQRKIYLPYYMKGFKASFRYRFSQGADTSMKSVSEVIATDALVVLQSVQKLPK